MGLATVTVSGRGETDRLLEDVVTRLHGEGVRVLGALRAPTTEDGHGHCNSDLRLLPDGPLVRITQSLGGGATACRMDAGALEDAVGITTERLTSNGADLVVLNKFGLSEAEGRGFRSLITQALVRGIPVLMGLSETHRTAFERFSDGAATTLQPDSDAILDWCRVVARPVSKPTGEAGMNHPAPKAAR